jgi:FdhE protein
LRAIVPGHPDSEYLGLLAELTGAQGRVLDHYRPEGLPDEVHLQRCRAHALPPLGIDRGLSGHWRSALEAILGACGERAKPAARQAMAALSVAGDSRLDEAAISLLELDYPALDPAQAPFVGAALQVHWTAMARALGEARLGPLDVPHVCPACGMPPVASVLAIDGPAPGTRYLHCALCGCEWHYPRGQCASCSERDKVAYLHVEGGSEAAKAETCDACRGYLKIFNREKDPLADPVADDLATLALDVLVDQAGYQRAGPNLLFIPGSA